jgi:UDP-2,4-diacetamido-2,4,6-trideoxy-beta-L-altropyranose hydrolase
MPAGIIFRADGSSAIGLGHIYRSCALAQVLKKSFRTTFATRNPSDDLRNIILGSVEKVAAIESDKSIEEETELLGGMAGKEDIIVLDGYSFTGDYQELLRKKTRAAIVCIDDIHKGYYHADAVINHIGGICIDDYQSVATTAFFLGTEYALVNPVFLGMGLRKHKNNQLLVCLGGADPQNHTLKVIKSVPVDRFDHTTVIIGEGFRYARELQEFSSGKKISIRQNLKPAEVASLMSECYYAILSPSTVSYEYLQAGGILYLYQIADNQQRVKEFYIEKGIAMDFQDFGKITIDDESMLASQRKFFDRKSHDRLFRIFDGLSFIKSTVMRKAIASDVDIIYEWANEKLARAMSYNNDPIPYNDHVNWFGNKINNPSSPYYIFEKDNKQVAQIRFDIKEGKALLSYSIGSEFRGKSLGVWILAEGIKKLTEEYKEVGTIAGFVKQENIASCRSFEKLRFKKEIAKEYPSSFKYTMEYNGFYN